MGGKSRKGGGVSKRLIQQIKGGNYRKLKKGKSKTEDDEKKRKIKPLFDEDEGTEGGS